MDAETTATVTKRKRNWWKVAFFVALIAFEGAREVAVIQTAKAAEPNVTPMVFAHGAPGSLYVNATGTWMRTDGGDPLMPTTVTIQCREEIGQCVEATTTLMNEFVFAPDVTFYEAVFTEDAVTYQNDFPTCARYDVRVDLKLKQVFAVRERKDDGGDCANIEPRIESQLGKPEFKALADGHFVPLLSMLSAVLD